MILTVELPNSASPKAAKSDPKLRFLPETSREKQKSLPPQASSRLLLGIGATRRRATARAKVEAGADIATAKIRGMNKDSLSKLTPFFFHGTGDTIRSPVLRRHVGAQLKDSGRLRVRVGETGGKESVRAIIACETERSPRRI